MFIKRILAIGFIFIFMLTGTTFAQEGYSEIYESTGSIFSLPENSVKGQLNVSVYGNTTNQIIKNGNFVSDTNWSKINNAVITNGVATLTASSSLTAVQQSSLWSGKSKTGNIIALIYEVTENTLSTSLLKANGASTNDFSSSIIDLTSTVGRHCKFITVTDGAGNDNQLTLYVPATVVSGNIKIKNIMLIDLTIEGLTSLTTDEVKTRFPYYLAYGVNSTNSVRIQIPNANIFDEKMEPGAYNTSTGIKESNTSTYRSVNKFRVEGDKTYPLISDVQGGYRLFYFDMHKNFISTELKVSVPTTFTPPSDGYVSFHSSAITSANYDTAKIAIGATTYVKHEFSEAYYTKTTRRVPNGTADYYDNQGTLHQLVSENVVYNGDESWGTFATGTGLNSDLAYARVTVPTNSKDSVDNSVNGFDGTYYYSSISATVATGHNVRISSDGYLYISIPKSLISAMPSGLTLDGFKEYLVANPVTLNYQLATPNPEEISIPPLIAYENGTVIIEPIVQDSAVYNESDGLVISNPFLPVEEVESIKRIYVDSSSVVHRQDLDPSSAISSIENGTNIILNNAQAGETYQFTYRYPQELTTIPTIEYSVPINQTGQINGNTNMIQQNRNILDTIIQDIDGLWNQLQKD